MKRYYDAQAGTGALRNPRRLLLMTVLLLAAVAGIAPAQGTQPIDTTRKSLKATMEVDAAAPVSTSTTLGAGGTAVQARASYGHMYSVQSTGTLGAKVGGAQDIGYARQLINSGQIPRFIDFSAEGLYSEHDIPTPSGDCNEKLCLSLGYGYAPTADNRSNAIFLQLGMNSNIKPGEFKRTPLQLAVVIDRSGSMQGASMNSVKTALHSLARKLGPDDEIMLVQFDDQAQVVLPATRVSDLPKVIAAIDGIRIGGGTDIEAGLALGFRELAALPARPGVSRRVMLFTDARPNVGRTDSGSFCTLTRQYADQGIGISAFGVGQDFGQELVYHITQLRGGNFFFLESPEKIARVFDAEFDYLVTPLVYDLDVKVRTPNGLKLTAVYGLPTWKPGSRDAELHVPTVFLSSNHGAIVLRYEKDGDGPLVLDRGDRVAEGTLSFTGVDGTKYSEDRDVRYQGAERLEPGTQFYSHDGMRMAVALTNIYFALRDGCTLLAEGKRKESVDAISRGRGIAMLENLMLMDKGLSDEIALLDKLQENIEKGTDVRTPASMPSE
ncbi:MAG TPA: VWA domain-containing protein [Candidatus Kapabacteria bacterium]|nr:VWA domain-containing protein [Candidatus Kapabacteria bacterium]